jgi:hypothetical protein
MVKFLNSCYNNEWSKKGGGLITILILIKRFSKKIIYKYLKQILRAVFVVTNNYPSTVKIKYEDESDQIMTELINLFIDNKDSNESIEDEDMFYNSLLYFHEEIINNIDSNSDYSRKISVKTFKQILKNKRIKKAPYLFFLIDKINKEDFFTYFYYIPLSNNDPDNKEKLEEINIKLKGYFSESQLKINQKFAYLITNLSHKLEINSNNFLPMISYSKALNILIKFCPENFIEYIVLSSLNIES